MDGILIPCPECGKELRLRDEKLLGKVGKCPKCSHRFKLEEPDEVQLELATDIAAPPMGTSAQWVPDAQPAAPPTATVPTHVAPAFPVAETNSVSTPATRSTRKKKKPDKLKLAIIGGSIVSTIAVVVALIVFGTDGGNKTNAKKKSDEKSPVAAAADQKPEPPPPAAGSDNSNREVVTGSKPPEGKPITLKFLPTGARMIIHLRPAEIWKTNSDAETVRLCLGSLGTWVEAKLREVLLFEPSLIEEVTICLFLADQNSAPEIAFYARLTETQKPSTFIEKFGGKPNTDYGRKIYVQADDGDQPAMAYMITDQLGKEFAAAPKLYAQEMVNAEQTPGAASGDLDQLLARTDNLRHATILFIPLELNLVKKRLFPESVHGLLGHFLDRFEDSKMSSVSWSLFFGDRNYDKFYSEILLRNKPSVSSRELQIDMNIKIDNLPDELLKIVRQMEPSIVAEKQLVGRLPLMYKAVHLQTTPSTGGPDQRLVRLTTVLPKHAGPNLAAASMYAWRMAQRTDFTKPVRKSPSTKIPKLLVDRIKLPVEVDFRRRPLQEAIAFIAEETHVRIEIDGDALKDAGYTKNMPQTMNLGTVSGVRALAAIMAQYEKMVIVLEEDKNRMTLMTKKFAAAKGLPPYQLK